MQRHNVVKSACGLPVRERRFLQNLDLQIAGILWCVPIKNSLEVKFMVSNDPRIRNACICTARSIAGCPSVSWLKWWMLVFGSEKWRPGISKTVPWSGASGLTLKVWLLPELADQPVWRESSWYTQSLPKLKQHLLRQVLIVFCHTRSIYREQVEQDGRVLLHFRFPCLQKTQAFMTSDGYTVRFSSTSLLPLVDITDNRDFRHKMHVGF